MICRGAVEPVRGLAVDLRVSWDAPRADEAREFAGRHHLALAGAAELPEPGAQRLYLLHFGAARLELRSWFTGAAGPVYVDFLAGASGYRRLHGGGRGEMIARAIGLRPGIGPLNVLDATAGLGQDGFVLACLGCRVNLLERHPVVHALLEDGLQRLRVGLGDCAEESGDVGGRLTLCHDSLLQWTSWTLGDDTDVIYLDPMFPEQRRKSLVRKEMQVFHALVGEDADGGELLQRALQAPVSRVVVKRPRIAPFLGDVKPSTTLSGKRCRYDIYARRRLR